MPVPQPETPRAASNTDTIDLIVKDYIQKLVIYADSYGGLDFESTLKLAEVSFYKHTQSKTRRHANTWNLWTSWVQKNQALSTSSSSRWKFGTGDDSSIKVAAKRYQEWKSQASPEERAEFDTFVNDNQSHSKQTTEKRRRTIWRRICSDLSDLCVEADRVGGHVYALAADNDTTSSGAVFTTRKGAEDFSWLLDGCSLGLSAFMSFARSRELEDWVSKVIRFRRTQQGANGDENLPEDSGVVRTQSSPLGIIDLNPRPSDAQIPTPSICDAHINNSSSNDSIAPAAVPETNNYPSNVPVVVVQHSLNTFPTKSRDELLRQCSVLLLAQFSQYVPQRERLPKAPWSDFLRKYGLTIELPSGWTLDEVWGGKKRYSTEHSRRLYAELMRSPPGIRIVPLAE